MKGGKKANKKEDSLLPRSIFEILKVDRPNRQSETTIKHDIDMVESVSDYLSESSEDDISSESQMTILQVPTQM